MKERKKRKRRRKQQQCVVEKEVEKAAKTSQLPSIAERGGVSVRALVTIYIYISQCNISSSI
jgi:hypothetical protein